MKSREDQVRREKCSQQGKVGRVMLLFLSLKDKKNKPVQYSFYSLKEVVREVKKDTN